MISLMSTVASLPFFLFTLPAGALADKLDRQKLICFINFVLAGTAVGLAVLVAASEGFTVTDVDAEAVWPVASVTVKTAVYCPATE